MREFEVTITSKDGDIAFTCNVIAISQKHAWTLAVEQYLNASELSVDLVDVVDTVNQ